MRIAYCPIRMCITYSYAHNLSACAQGERKPCAGEVGRETAAWVH